MKYLIRESYNDTQYRKILNKSRYEYRSQTSSTLKDIYIYVSHIHVNSETYIIMADLLPTLYYRATIIYLYSHIKATSQNYIKLYTLLIIYLYVYYISTSHTTESHRRRNFTKKLLNILNQNNALLKHVNKNIITRQHDNTIKYYLDSLKLRT